MKIKWVPPAKVEDVAELTLTRRELELLVQAAQEGYEILTESASDSVARLLTNMGYPTP